MASKKMEIPASLRKGLPEFKLWMQERFGQYQTYIPPYVSPPDVVRRIVFAPIPGRFCEESKRKEIRKYLYGELKDGRNIPLRSGLLYKAISNEHFREVTLTLLEYIGSQSWLHLEAHYETSNENSEQLLPKTVEHSYKIFYENYEDLAHTATRLFMECGWDVRTQVTTFAEKARKNANKAIKAALATMGSFKDVKPEALRTKLEQTENVDDVVNLYKRLRSELGGQDFALVSICRRVVEWRRGSQDKPLVLWLGGRTTLGKSFVGEVLARALVEMDLCTKEHLMDAGRYAEIEGNLYTNKADAWTLFGVGAGYVGHDEESVYEKALRAAHERECVCVINEIERIHGTVLEAHMNLLRDGTVNGVKKTKAIFMLTSNLRQEALDVATPLMVTLGPFALAAREWVRRWSESLSLEQVSAIDGEVRDTRTIPSPLVNRVTEVIPFLSLIEDEQRKRVVQGLLYAARRRAMIDSAAHVVVRVVEEDKFLNAVVEKGNDSQARGVMKYDFRNTLPVLDSTIAQACRDSMDGKVRIVALRVTDHGIEVSSQEGIGAETEANEGQEKLKMVAEALKDEKLAPFRLVRHFRALLLNPRSVYTLQKIDDVKDGEDLRAKLRELFKSTSMYGEAAQKEDVVFTFELQNVSVEIDEGLDLELVPTCPRIKMMSFASTRSVSALQVKIYIKTGSGICVVKSLRELLGNDTVEPKGNQAEFEKVTTSLKKIWEDKKVVCGGVIVYKPRTAEASVARFSIEFDVEAYKNIVLHDTELKYDVFWRKNPDEQK